MNTVAFIDDLEKAGMPHEQAKVLAERFEGKEYITKDTLRETLDAALDKHFIKTMTFVVLVVAPIYLKFLTSG